MKENAPKIISINPPNGAADVDPNLRAITITFDRPTSNERPLLVHHESESKFPGIDGQPQL